MIKAELLGLQAIHPQCNQHVQGRLQTATVGRVRVMGAESGHQLHVLHRQDETDEFLHFTRRSLIALGMLYA
jgi:hypothetical protein